MSVQIKVADFRQQIINLANNKDHNTIFSYLRTTGMVLTARSGVLNISEDCIDRVKYMVSPIENGDLVWNVNNGLLLVIDTRPAVNNDGHHFRALRVMTAPNGDLQIISDMRSEVVDDLDTFKLRATSFDIKTIDKLSYERYLAYCKINKINEQLSAMKEFNND